MTSSAPTSETPPAARAANGGGGSIGLYARWTVLASLATIGAGAIRLKVVAVILGPEGVGLATELQQIVTLLMVPATVFGGAAFVAAFARQASDRAARERTFQTAQTATTVYGACAVLGALIVAHLLLGHRSVQPVVLLAGLAAAATLGTTLVALRGAALVAVGEVRHQALLASATAVITGTAVALATFSHGLLGHFIAGSVTPWLIILLFAGFIARGLDGVGGRVRPTLDGVFLKTAIVVGAITILSGLAVQGALSTIRWRLAVGGGEAANGNFQAAYAIAGGYFAIILQSLGNVVFPRYASAPDGEVAGHVEEAIDFVAKYGPPLVLMAIAARTPIMRLLYSTKFAAAADAVGFQMAGDLAKAHGWAIAGPLLYRAHTRAFLITETFAAVALVAFPCALIPVFGVSGASIGCSIAYIVYALVAREVVKRTLRFSVPMKSMYRMVAFVLIAGSTVELTRRAPVLNYLVAAVGLCWAVTSGATRLVTDRIAKKVLNRSRTS